MTHAPSGSTAHATRPVHLDPDDVRTLFDWHGGQWSAVYALASSANAGNVVTADMVDAATSELERDLSRERHYLDPSNDLDAADRADVLERIASLENLLSNLEAAEHEERMDNPKRLPKIHAGSPMVTNAHINRERAAEAFNAGMSAAEIAAEWPEVFKLDADGRIGQRYDYELADGSGRFETNRMITRESLKSAIARHRLARRDNPDTMAHDTIVDDTPPRESRRDAMHRRGVDAVEEVGREFRRSMEQGRERMARRDNPAHARFRVARMGLSSGGERLKIVEASYPDFESARRDAAGEARRLDTDYVIIDSHHGEDGVVWRSSGAVGHHRLDNPACSVGCGCASCVRRDNPAGVGDWQADEEYERSSMDSEQRFEVWSRSFGTVVGHGNSRAGARDRHRGNRSSFEAARTEAERLAREYDASYVIDRFLESEDSVVWRSSGAEGHHRRDNPIGKLPPAHSVADYKTGELLEGWASDELVRESMKVDTGAVPAFRDSRGLWEFVPPSLVSDYKRRGAKIFTVYVEAPRTGRPRRDNPHSLRLRTAPAEIENPSEDEHQADMLVIAADSEGTLYPMKKEIMGMLEKRRRRGDYDPSRAPQAFAYYIDEAARLLAKENRSSGEDTRSWTEQFPKRVRRLAAESVAASVDAEARVQAHEADANAEIYAERSPAEGGRARRDNPLYPALGPHSDMSGPGTGSRRDNPAGGSETVPLKLLQPRLGNPLEAGCSQETISRNIGKELRAHPDMPVAQGAAIAYSHARRQGCLLPGKRKKGSRKKNPSLDVAETILQQLGGAGPLTAMIGAKQFLGSADELQFKWAAKSKKKINTVVIKLMPSDTYNVTFWAIRGYDMKEVSEWEDVQASELRPLFERETGLATRLNNPAGAGAAS